MTLTALRRLVLLGSLVALGAAGGAAWFSLEARAEPRPPEAWQKLFPRKSAGGAEAVSKGPSPLPEYVEAASWPQGELPPKVDPNARPAEAPKVDPFETKYRLNSIQVGRFRADSYAQLKAAGIQEAFSIGLGERIPASPLDPANRAMSPWRLDAVDPGGPGKPATALFRHVETAEEKTLSAALSTGVDLTAKAGAVSEIAGATTSRAGQPDRAQPPRIIAVREDRVKGEFEYEIPEEEADWLGFYSDDEASKISVEETKDPATGKPDGFRLKAVPADSRAYAAGFRNEDKVISVNGETVTSTADALAKGRRQYDGGTSTFQIRAIRKGKEVNFTFRAPRKKRDRGK